MPRDGPYWDFVERHRDVLAGNRRSRNAVRSWDGMDEGVREAVRARAAAARRELAGVEPSAQPPPSTVLRMVAQAMIALPERYRVERRIASGGMSSVWAAWDEVLRRQVAVKVLSPVFGEDEEHRARFTREAHATARMSDCGHVVTIYDIGEHAGRAYIVMELFGEGTVAHRLREPGPIDARDGAALAARGRLGARLRARARHRPPRREAGEPPARLRRPARGGRLRDRSAVGRDAAAHRDGDRPRHRGVPVARAGARRAGDGRERPVRARGSRVGAAVGDRPYRAEHFAAQARQHVEAPVPRITERAPSLPAACDDVFLRALAKDPAERPGRPRPSSRTSSARCEAAAGTRRGRCRGSCAGWPARRRRRRPSLHGAAVCRRSSRWSRRSPARRSRS